MGISNGSATRVAMVSNSFSTQSKLNSGQISVERGLTVIEPTTSSSSRMVIGSSAKIFSTTLARRRIGDRPSVAL